MILLLWILYQDSIPPLPDFSIIEFPEPKLWVEPLPMQITLSGYYGQFSGADINFDYQRFKLQAEYQKEDIWFNTTKINFGSSYSIPLPFLWIRPSIKGLYTEDCNSYRFINPGLEITTTPAWAIVFMKLNSDNWRLNNRDYREYTGILKIIFDRAEYLPFLQIEGSTLDDKLITRMTAGINVKSIRVSAGSFLPFGSGSDYRLSFSKPEFSLNARLESGRRISYLRNHFITRSPMQYTVPLPEESLKIAVNFTFNFRIKENQFTLKTAYNDFSKKLIPGPDFFITSINNVRTGAIMFIIKNKLTYKALEIHHQINGAYHRADRDIPFLPEYSIQDSLAIKFSVIEFINLIEYLDTRHGITKLLPKIKLISPELGIRIKPVKLFFRVFNVLNQQKEIFDNYTLSYRKYALGLQFRHKF